MSISTTGSASDFTSYYEILYSELLLKKFDSRLLYRQVAEMSEHPHAHKYIAGYLRFIQDALDVFMMPDLFHHANSIYVSRASLGRLHEQQLQGLAGQMEEAAEKIEQLLTQEAPVGIHLRVTEADLPPIVEDATEREDNRPEFPKRRVPADTISLRSFPDFLRFLDGTCQKYGVANRYRAIIYPYTETSTGNNTTTETHSIARKGQQHQPTTARCDLHCSLADVAFLFKAMKGLGMTRATDKELAGLFTINGEPITDRQLRQAKSDIGRQTVATSEDMRALLADFITQYLHTLQICNENELQQFLQTLKRILREKQSPSG